MKKSRARRRKIGVNTGTRVGYAFDAVPKFLPEMVRDGGLYPEDIVVLIAILSFHRDTEMSCWVANEQIERMTGFSRSTLYRCLARLKTTNLVEKVKCEIPDPLDKKNFTGHRFLLKWTFMGCHPDVRAVSAVRQPKVSPEEQVI